MQWSSLALEEPPSWSWLRPLVQVSMLHPCFFKICWMWFFWHHIWVQQIWVLFSLWKGNCETSPRKTSHFMSNDCLKLQETPFSKAILTIFYMKMVSRRQIRHLWVASDTTISLHIVMCQSDSQFWPLLSTAAYFSGLAEGLFDILICCTTY